MELVTYCGLYCDLCAERTRIPQTAQSLRAAMTEEGWPFWGASVPGFTEFWAFLENLGTGPGCPGCKAGGGYPECQIRICARERGLEQCAQCADFPCEHIEALAAVYPTLIADNRRMKAVGLEPQQYALFHSESHKEEESWGKVEKALDRIRDRFGRNAIKRARLID